MQEGRRTAILAGMKTVWIVLGVLAALGLTCCGGMFFLGKGLFDSVAKTNDEADQYSAQFLAELGKDWNISVLEKHASREFQEQVPKDDLQTLLLLYKAKLGSLKSAGEFTASNIQAKSTTTDKFVLVTTRADAEFEKGPGKVQFEVIKREDRWQVLSLEVQSDALKK